MISDSQREENQYEERTSTRENLTSGQRLPDAPFRYITSDRRDRRRSCRIRDRRHGGKWSLIAISVTACVILVILGVILLCGLKVLNPNEAYVLTLFGNYYGTIKKEGFFWVNPFCSAINPTVKAVPVATGSVEGRLTTQAYLPAGRK